MTITSSVLSDLFIDGQQPIRISPPSPRSPAALSGRGDNAARNYLALDALRRKRKNLWSPDEHERFLEGLERFPKGPWRLIADHVATKNTRQTMTHAQKYRQKILRRKKKVEALANGTSPSSRGNNKRKASNSTLTPLSPVSPASSIVTLQHGAGSSTTSASSSSSVDCDPFTDLELLSAFLDEMEPLELMSEGLEEGTPLSEPEQTPRTWNNEFAWDEMLSWPVVNAQLM